MTQETFTRFFRKLYLHASSGRKLRLKSRYRSRQIQKHCQQLPQVGYRCQKLQKIAKDYQKLPMFVIFVKSCQKLPKGAKSFKKLRLCYTAVKLHQNTCLKSSILISQILQFHARFCRNCKFLFSYVERGLGGIF